MMRKRVRPFHFNKVKMLAVMFSFLFFIFSMYVYSFMSVGDIKHYKNAYNGMSFSIISSYSHYRGAIGSWEIVPFFISYIFSILTSYEFYASFLNFIMAYFLSIILLSRKYNRWIVFALVFPLNYYFLVLSFGAERLKVAIIFMLAFYYLYNVKGDYKRSFSAIIMSLLSHVQMVILYFSVALSSMGARRIIKFAPVFLLVISFVVILLLANPFVIDILLNKFKIYVELSQVSLGSFLGIFLLIVGCGFDKKKLKSIFTLSLVFAFVIMLVGATRINIMLYFLYVGFFLTGHTKIFSFKFLIFLASSIYFNYKGYFFIIDVISGGDGFN
ncbi:hypothetical protein CWN98_12430 [Vibrio splendidus]|uniref:hypothetical protein n=1 Tax=Vibrio splendidus TaxID=29497 RepID=UPI000D3AF72F|nr:hypothetical protein [Vibrio splendidus]PTO86872.1 hypothetical protein CWN98_12430 [Vibrio splendidus]PTP47512.1 hypothetical protein CWO10_11895 [Vibrio splendidus]